MGLITAGVAVVKCVYAFANSNIVTSAAHKANGYQYSTLSEIQLSPRSLRNGLATTSPPNAVNVLAAGMFLLCPRAFLRGNTHSNESSALFGLSAQILKGIS
jgi:hypothetical protein